MNEGERKRWVTEYKQGQGCAVCGESFPACLDLHHIDPSTKEAVISQMMYVHKDDDAMFFREIGKCVVLCTNCHRKVHWYMRQTRASQMAAEERNEEPVGLLEDVAMYFGIDYVDEQRLLEAVLDEVRAEWDTMGRWG